MSRRLPLTGGLVARTATARLVLRGGVAERTGEALTGRTVAERVGWVADLAAGMAAGLLARRWNARDVARLASGTADAGRALPSNAWMALRRLGWGVAVPGGVKVNDRIVRMAQEQAGRILRGARYRAEVVAGVLATWPADPGKRTPPEWDAVREAIPDGRALPGSVIKARTRQITAFLDAHGRLPVDVFELEEVPRAAPMLVLAAEVGIAVVTVPPKNTSKHCPQCLMPLRHCTAPDRPTTPGWKWAICPNPACGWQGDRDHGAWRRIAARGLTHQHHTTLDRAAGQMSIGRIIDKLETSAVLTPTAPSPARGGDRSKTGPTPRRSPRPAPRRRGAPSTPPPTAGGSASGGTRSHGPQTAPRGLPAPGRAHTRAYDQLNHPHHPPEPDTAPDTAPAQRSGAGRGFSPARPRHPTPVGRSPSHNTQYDHGSLN